MAGNKEKATPESGRPVLDGKGLPLPEDAIGRRIREKREERNLNVSQLSALTKEVSGDGKGLSRAVISGYENGEYKPGTRELRILCSALDTSPNWLVFGNETLPKQSAAVASIANVDLPELGIARLLYILTSLPEEEFNAVATLLVALSKNDKSLRAGLSDNADVMGRMITLSHALEFSGEWGAYIEEHMKSVAPKLRALEKRIRAEKGLPPSAPEKKVP